MEKDNIPTNDNDNEGSGNNKKIILNSINNNNNNNNNSNPCKDKHLIKEELYCKQCQEFVCLSCFRVHSSHASNNVIVIQDFITECNITEGLNRLVKEISGKQKNNEEIFKSQVERVYQENNERITNYFRIIHDSLHYKEVELKRILKSHFDENEDNYIKLLSKVEHDISHSNRFLGEVNTTSNNNSKNEKSYFESCIKSRLLLDSNETDYEYKYQEYSFDENHTPLNKLTDLVELLEIKNHNQEITSKSNAKQEPQTLFPLVIKEFGKIKTPFYSSSFKVLDFTLSVYIYPKGNKDNGTSLSLYLDVLGERNSSFKVKIKFIMEVVNQMNKMSSIKRTTEYTFREDSSRWGYKSFIPFSQLHNPELGYIVDDTLIINIDIINAQIIQ